MTAPKRYTEREMVLAKRRAFVMGVVAKERANLSGHTSEVHAFIRSGKCPPTPEGAAEETYPFPKVERPRVLGDAKGVKWRVVEGRIEYGYTTMWHPLRENSDCGMYLTAERIGLLADLLATPNELIDDDGSVSDTPPAGAET